MNLVLSRTTSFAINPKSSSLDSIASNLHLTYLLPNPTSKLRRIPVPESEVQYMIGSGIPRSIPTAKATPKCLNRCRHTSNLEARVGKPIMHSNRPLLPSTPTKGWPLASLKGLSLHFYAASRNHLQSSNSSVRRGSINRISSSSKS